MKLSMHNWMRPEALTTTIPRLARCGYDGIELASEPREIERESTRKLLRDHGMACAGTLALFLGGRDLLHEDAYIREGSLTYLLETVELTADLGGTFVTVPCTVGKMTPSASPEVEWRWYVDALGVAAERARSVGVRLAIEPLNRFETYLINRADQALALAEAVGPDVGVCLDIFHMNIEEVNPAAAIKAVGDRLVHFHVADNNRLPPGQGAVDWPGLITALRSAGYDGWLSVEFMPALDRTPVATRRMAEVDEATELTAGMRQWIRDHGSGVLPDTAFEQYTRQSIEFLRGVISTAA